MKVKIIEKLFDTIKLIKGEVIRLDLHRDMLASLRNDKIECVDKREETVSVFCIVTNVTTNNLSLKLTDSTDINVRIDMFKTDKMAIYSVQSYTGKLSELDLVDTEIYNPELQDSGILLQFTRNSYVPKQAIITRYSERVIIAKTFEREYTLNIVDLDKDFKIIPIEEGEEVKRK